MDTSRKAERELWNSVKDKYPKLARVVDNAPGSRTPDEVYRYLFGSGFSEYENEWTRSEGMLFTFEIPVKDIPLFVQRMQAQLDWTSVMYEEYLAWCELRNKI